METRAARRGHPSLLGEGHSLLHHLFYAPKQQRPADPSAAKNGRLSAKRKPSRHATRIMAIGRGHTFCVNGNGPADVLLGREGGQCGRPRIDSARRKSRIGDCGTRSASGIDARNGRPDESCQSRRSRRLRTVDPAARAACVPNSSAAVAQSGRRGGRCSRSLLALVQALGPAQAGPGYDALALPSHRECVP